LVPVTGFAHEAIVATAHKVSEEGVRILRISSDEVEFIIGNGESKENAKSRFWEVLLEEETREKLEKRFGNLREMIVFEALKSTISDV
jgi:hypothetical protein